MFSHKFSPSDFPKLSTQNKDGRRYYSVEGNLYPSVTSVLSILSKEGIQAWRDSIGHEIADFESRRAANRGTRFHKICEDYLCNKDISEHRAKVLPFGLFSLVKKEIDRIDNIHALEQTLFSHNLKLAGRVDCVAEFDNILSIIDFKSANKEKTPEILENHYLQETAYAIMWGEITKDQIDQIVTIVACENGEKQISIEKPQFFINRLESVIEEFNESQGILN